jgi:putative Mg2+ transporter-C (MgtC) family protein
MALADELQLALKILIAFFLGAVIGYDRERDGVSAGIRTYAAVCLGSALFTDIGENLNDVAASSRIISTIISGIGFLGAGIIFKNEKTNTASGLTTAATIWCTAGVGVAIGMDMYIIALVATAAVYFLLVLHKFPWYKKWQESIKPKDNHLEDAD